MMKIFNNLMMVAIGMSVATITLQAQDNNPNIISTNRADGRYLSTRGLVQQMMENNPPVLEFNEKITAENYNDWRTAMKQSMTELMRHPQVEIAEPQMVKSVQRDGYRVEKWESYPLEGVVVPYLVLIPDGIDETNKAPLSMLCIPGFGQTKELLAGEKVGDFDLEQGGNAEAGHSAMARTFAKEGWVAVAVDNPSFGELADNGKADFANTSRILLEMGWSYLGLSSYQDKVILDWMKSVPYIDPTRLVVSGFSLGTEPLMAIGLMDDDIYAFVYNDFLCTTRERILVMTKPNADGVRPFPNGIEHLIPTFLNRFDFPDIVSALSPRPVICTEGGLDRDFRKIAHSYEMAGCPDNFVYYHYPKYAPDSMRTDYEVLPKGLDRTEYFNMVNCDSPSHFFKDEKIVPWLKSLIVKEEK